MNKGYKKRLDQIVIQMKQDKRIVDPSILRLSFDLVGYMHSGSSLKVGMHYTDLNLSIAEILCKEGFLKNIVAAGLLYDAFETGVLDLVKIMEATNDEVAQIVLSFNEIKDLDSMEMEDEDLITSLSSSFEKRMSVYILFAYYIVTLQKEADKMTVERVKKYILPLAKELDAFYFYNELSNLCFKFSKDQMYTFIKDSFSKQLNDVQPSISKMEEKLRCICDELQCSFIEEPIRERQVYERLFRETNNIERDVKSQIKYSMIPVKHYFILFESDYARSFYMMYNQYLYPDYYWIHEERYGDLFSVVLEDEFENHFQITPVLKDMYLTFQNGANEGINILTESYDLQDEINDRIYVYLRNGQRQQLPQGSTVLDLAFAIHPEVGLCAMNATVNNQLVDIFTPLQTGDKVIIHADTKKNEYMNIKAELKWFAHIRSKKAERALIRYFDELIKK